MKPSQRAALLAELTDRLRAQESWCGETHLQKSVYLLQELLDVPTEFKFVLYKFGPYSFDLGDELTSLRADGLLGLEVRHPSYGPSFQTTDASVRLRQRFPATLKKYVRQIEFVADKVGAKGVAELERLATALYVTRQTREPQDHAERARRIVALKPHVTLEAAAEAVQALDQMIDEVRAEFAEQTA